MDTEPTSWKELVKAPEIPKKFQGQIIETVEYWRKSDEPILSFIPVLYKTQSQNEDCKWYISNSTAVKLEANAYRPTFMFNLPINMSSYVCNYEDTKAYADWYFGQKGQFISKIGDKIEYHFILLLFSKDVNWEPFHNDFINQKPSNITLLDSAYSETKITQKFFGSHKIPAMSTEYTDYDFRFMRAFIALTAYRYKFLNRSMFEDFLDDQIHYYRLRVNYINIPNDSLKRHFEHFCYIIYMKSPILKPLIYRYFFSSNDGEGAYVKKALQEYQTISFFNIIYRFLAEESKRVAHFDEIILKEARLYIAKIKELEAKLVNLLPYAELLTFNFSARADNWKNLARVSLIFCLEKDTHVSGEWFYKRFINSIADLDEKMKTAEVNANDGKNEIYVQFQKLDDVHKIMKTIPWKNWMEKKCAEDLCCQLLDDDFY